MDINMCGFLGGGVAVRQQSDGKSKAGRSDMADWLVELLSFPARTYRRGLLVCAVFYIRIMISLRFLFAATTALADAAPQRRDCSHHYGTTGLAGGARR
jgi:hypothetical protein